MKKLALLWLTAVALMFGSGASVGAAPGMSGFHGQGGFHNGHGMGEHRGYDRGKFTQHDFDGRNHFHSHGHVGVIIGFPVWWPPIDYPPPVYIEQGAYYWYCPDPGGYYPDVQSCATEWLRVIPGSAPP